MKALLNTFILGLALLFSTAANAQKLTKAEKKAAEHIAIKQKIDSVNYTFKANYVVPVRSISRVLPTSDYDLRITKDSVIAYLPYFGRVYMKAPLSTTDGGLKFTSTDFDYKATPKKKGGWQITIVVKDTEKANRLILDISENGYATLSTTSNYRDPISFYGNIVTDKKGS